MANLLSFIRLRRVTLRRKAWCKGSCEIKIIFWFYWHNAVIHVFWACVLYNWHSLRVRKAYKCSYSALIILLRVHHFSLATLLWWTLPNHAVLKRSWDHAPIHLFSWGYLTLSVRMIMKTYFCLSPHVTELVQVVQIFCGGRPWPVHTIISKPCCW